MCSDPCHHAQKPEYSLGSKRAYVSFPARIGLGLIWIYRHSLSLFMGRGCRYAPTCSDYTAEAFKAYGLWAGGWIGLSRILRCNPWGASGFDPIPAELPAHARWYLPWRYGRWSGAHIPQDVRLD
ncbi:membrane protein insertion efficiency factor YidD [Roseibium hamelinense]|uniref:membrane protein insertion efficiency factor YidD n=1 Tax=Roseibium hamelinense TaxID=150831 RepID=UPI0011A1822D|nr:membrane protein insertion efficiency factor YidD [Roseibium hamelinense]MTI42237.1 membrane protein insertion efficiency factor YidD [Roseibium hamelinense]